MSKNALGKVGPSFHPTVQSAYLWHEWCTVPCDRPIGPLLTNQWSIENMVALFKTFSTFGKNKVEQVTLKIAKEVINFFFIIPCSVFRLTYYHILYQETRVTSFAAV